MPNDIGPTHYKVLGVSEDATEEEIRAAFRKLATGLAPQNNRGNEENFVEHFESIKAAKDLLVDPQKRADYDAWLAEERSLTMDDIFGPPGWSPPVEPEVPEEPEPPKEPAYRDSEGLFTQIRDDPVRQRITQAYYGQGAADQQATAKRASTPSPNVSGKPKPPHGRAYAPVTVSKGTDSVSAKVVWRLAMLAAAIAFVVAPFIIMFLTVLKGHSSISSSSVGAGGDLISLVCFVWFILGVWFLLRALYNLFTGHDTD